MQTSLIVVASLLGVLLFATAAFAEKAEQTAKATFVVHCYDVGAGALEGRPGVLAVERGWSDGREVDRVAYDPQTVSIMQLENWLKAAGTYVGTLEPPMSSVPAGEMSR